MTQERAIETPKPANGQHVVGRNIVPDQCLPLYCLRLKN